MARIPKGIDPNLFKGLMSSGFVPEDLELNDFIESPKEQEEVKKDIDEQISSPNSQLGERVLTKAESEAIDEHIKSTIERANKVRNKIAQIKEAIDAAALTGDGSELSFNLDIRRRPVLKKAVRRVFGRTTNEITYSMYKQALEAKRRLEQEEIDEYIGEDDVS